MSQDIVLKEITPDVRERLVRGVRKLARADCLLVDGLPPNFEKIKAALPKADDAGVVFAHGDKVYGRGLKKLSPELHAHEAVHLARQQTHPAGVDGWWDQYLADADFRFEEELYAHRAEYARYCERHMHPVKRHMELQRIARRLASPLYNAGVPVSRCMYLINCDEGALGHAMGVE